MDIGREGHIPRAGEWADPIQMDERRQARDDMQWTDESDATGLADRHEKRDKPEAIGRQNPM
jgi:hypothetical protein